MGKNKAKRGNSAEIPDLCLSFSLLFLCLSGNKTKTKTKTKTIQRSWNKKKIREQKRVFKVGRAMVVGAWKFRKVVRKMGIPCCSFSTTTTTRSSSSSNRRSRSRRSHANNADVVDDPDNNNISSSTTTKQQKNIFSDETQSSSSSSSSSVVKSLCAICLEALSYSTGSNSPGQAIFTAQCSHAFHFTCISSNVRHGSVTCPICRAQWTQLPRNLHYPHSSQLLPPCSSSGSGSSSNNNGSSSSSSNNNGTTDPILRILDDSIATFRVHRRSSLRSARYNDDDPIEQPDNDITPNHLLPRLHLTLLPVPLGHSHNFPPYGHPSLQVIGPIPPYHHDPCGLFSSAVHHHFTSSTSSQHTSPNRHNPYFCSNNNNNTNNRAYLSVKLAHQQATDLVLVASPNGPHLRLLKQSMALVVFSLRSVDRLAIVTYSSAATRAFPLRRMTSHGKRTALQVIDRLFYMGEADPGAGLKKGIKILEDRSHRNTETCILHLSDCPTRSYQGHDMVEFPIPIHRFHVGFGFGTSNGFVMHEFEEFLARLLGGVIRETQLRIGNDGGIIRLGELRGGEERRIPLDLGDNDYVSVSYSYIESGVEECLRTGEIDVSIGDKREDINEGEGEAGGGRDMMSIGGGRTSSAESWDYHDPYMARRWAKHLHGYRL